MEIPSFADGLGRRTIREDVAGERCEALRLCAEIAQAATTEAALVERAARLADFRHPAFARVLRVERLAGVTGGLAVVSDAQKGVRLSDLLRRAAASGAEQETGAALWIIQQVTSAVAALHACSRDASHGTLGPERVVMRADGTAVLMEYVFATAFEQMQLSRTQLWTQFRVPVPTVAGTARFDQQTDVMQIGVLALSVLLGRVLSRDDFPQRLPALLEEVAGLDTARDPTGRLSRPVRSWLVRALQVDPRSAFRTAIEADSALVAALAEAKTLRLSPSGVQALISRCSTGREPAFGASGEPRVAPHGAVVIIPPRTEATPGAGRRRPWRDAADSPPSVHVIADLSAEPGGARNMPARRSFRPGSIVRRESEWTPLSRALRLSLMVFGLVLLFGASYLGARAYLRVPPRAPETGTLVVQSRPAGAEVIVDGQPNGRTPATLELAAGEHTLELRAGRGRALVPVTIVAGTQLVRRIEVRPAPKSRKPKR